MLRLNETLVALDPAEALEDESGVFEVTSPGGEKFQLVCRSGRSITNLRSTHEKGQQTGNWRVRKIAELRGEQETA